MLRPYRGLYSHNLVIYRDFKDGHVHGNLLQRMNIPWSLEDHTAPIRAESGCRNCRNFSVGSQRCPGLQLAPRELLLLMANSSGNSILCAGHPSRETSFAFRLWFEMGEEERRIQKLVGRRVWKPKGQSKLNSLFSLWWFKPSRICWNQWAQVEWQHGAWCCKGWTMPSALKFYVETAVPV